MRPLFVCLAGLCAAVLVATPASAGVSPPDPAPGGPQRPHEDEVPGPANIDALSVSVTRQPGTRDGVSVEFDRTSRTASGVIPAGARRFVFLFDRSIRFNPRDFPTCSLAVIESDGPQACPPESQVGQAVGSYLGGQQVRAAAYNARVAGGHGILLHFPDTGLTLEQTIEPAAAPYPKNYRWAIDELLMPDGRPPQDRPGTSRFTLSFGATRVKAGRTVSYVETGARAGAKLSFGLWSEFVTGQVLLPTARAVLPS